ncbi:MAG: hypothetical protein A3G38_01165 [Omnitrophica WOR_2 bacterium RIFCSPLOWO2_12_FULL_51_8]|nr:MAG: hypothetical protein A3G38_01165 [Omnitrophica WOR_2 bacterium RIFCSPLOWO2_12_FULL_51_8]
MVGPAGYENILNIIGFNYRLTEIQAAVAIEQFKKLEAINRARIGFVNWLNERLSQFDFLEIMDGRKDCVSTYYTYPILFRPDVAGVHVEEFRTALNTEGMYFARGYKPLYEQPIYQRRMLFKHGYPFGAPENQGNIANYKPGACPMAEALRDEVLISEHIRLPNTLEDFQDIVKAVEKISGVF